MNTPAPPPSKAHMQSLIDTSIIPNPYEPVVGDVYGREPSSRIDGLPLRVVVLALGEDDIDGNLSIMEDGREESLSNLPAYLASIHGIEPIGRVRAHEPAPEVVMASEDMIRLLDEYQEYPEDIVRRLLNAAAGDQADVPSLLREAATTIDNMRNGRGG